MVVSSIDGRCCIISGACFLVVSSDDISDDFNTPDTSEVDLCNVSELEVFLAGPLVSSALG